MKEKNINRIKNLILFVIIIFISSCTHRPPCINEKLDGLQISWGEYNKITKITRGYMLQSNGKLYFYENQGGTKEPVLKKIESLADLNYCYYLKHTQKSLLRIQLVYTPGVISRFVEYNAPVTNTFMRGMWNPLFKQNGSEKFVELYEKLMELVPQEESHKKYLLREVRKIEFENKIPIE